MAVDALDPSNMTLDASGTAARARLSLLPAPAQGRVAVAAVAATAAAAAAVAARAHTQVLGLDHGHRRLAQRHRGVEAHARDRPAAGDLHLR